MKNGVSYKKWVHQRHPTTLVNRRFRSRGVLGNPIFRSGQKIASNQGMSRNDPESLDPERHLTVLRKNISLPDDLIEGGREPLSEHCPMFKIGVKLYLRRGPSKVDFSIEI